MRFKRTIGSGWLTPGDGDPCGTRVVVVQRALREHPHIVGLFWEHAQLALANAFAALEVCLAKRKEN